MQGVPEQNDFDENRLEWHFLQCFGQPNAAEDAPNADLLSALEFDQTGEYLATGDRGGRIVLLAQNKDNQMEYQYLTEFQSHSPDFDYLKSMDIIEKINAIAWLRNSQTSRLLLSSNDKQVKLWKVYEKQVVNVVNFNVQQQAQQLHQQHRTSLGAAHGPGPPTQINSAVDLKVPRVVHSTRTMAAKCKRQYATTTHSYFINSVSVSPDQTTFLSSDDLIIYLWHIDRSDDSYVAVDIKPSSMQDLAEVITEASFHPTDCNVLAYASSKGAISMCDLRQQDVSSRHAITFRDESVEAGNSFFSEFVNSVSLLKFTPDGRHMVSRNYMHAFLWDVRQNRQPLRCFQVHEHLWDKLMELYENEAIFDKLGCAVSADGMHVAAGTYSELCVFNMDSDAFTILKACGSPVAVHGAQTAQRNDDPSNFAWKVHNVAWHPQQDLVVATALNSLYTYCARTPADDII